MNTEIEQSVREKLFSFKEMVSDNCVITGGHFVSGPSQDKNLNPGTLLSFEIAIQVFRETSKVKKNIGLGILINNIGTTCGLNTCSLQEVSNDKFVFPHHFKELLIRNNVPFDHVQIYWEKYLRNRGKKEFNKRGKSIGTFSMDEEGWWLTDADGKKYMMTRSAAKDPYGTPACPLIMAAYAIEQKKRNFTSSLNFWYIDTDNADNIPNHFMIEKGYEVAKMFDTNITVKNVYFTKTRVMTNF